ncbi:MAG: thiamine ABC transporter substrate binding subunit [Paracoccaceae bacterium]
MNNRLTLAAALVVATSSASAQTANPELPELVVYTYDSFASEWGPGPAIKASFEAECACTLTFVAAGDAAEVLSRLRLEGSRSAADVVVGLDSSLIPMAKESGLFTAHGQDMAALTLPIDWDDATYLPVDWGYFAFVYDTTRVETPPTSFVMLDALNYSIIIQDPRSSSPGLGLLLWIKAAFGDQSGAIWEGLADQIVTVTPGWSEAYGLFTSGEADMVLSYTTSPAYHVIVEGDDTKRAATFAEGHYMQIELAAQLASSEQPALAAAFLAHLISPAVQDVIPTTNWMYPAAQSADLPDGFAAPPARALNFPTEWIAQNRQAAVDEWLAALAR